VREAFFVAAHQEKKKKWKEYTEPEAIRATMTGPSLHPNPHFFRMMHRLMSITSLRFFPLSDLYIKEVL